MISEFMISSRQQMQSFSCAVPAAIRSAALPSHTSVPCDRPEMRTSSSIVLGCVSSSMPRTNLVPNSGMPYVPVVQ